MKKHLINAIKALWVPILMFSILWVCMPQKINAKTVVTILRQAIAPAVLGWGVMFNIKVGNWDFSVGASVLTASIIGGNLAKMLGLGFPGVIILCAVVGLLCGGIVGGMFCLLKVPSIIVSIGVLLTLESICSIVFGGSGVSLDSSFKVLSSNQLFIIIFGICAFILAYIIYNYRPFGYHVVMVGQNAGVADTCGVSAYKTKFLCMAIAGLFAGLYAAMNLGSTGVTRTVTSMGTMGVCFNAMMCVFVGMSLGKSVNFVVAIYIGSIMMKIIDMTLIAINFPSTYSQTIIALFVLLAMCASNIGDMKAAADRHKESFQLMANARSTSE